MEKAQHPLVKRAEELFKATPVCCGGRLRLPTEVGQRIRRQALLKALETWLDC